MRLDRETIRSLCTEQSFERGVGYFEAGWVKVVDASPSLVKAVVSGTDDYQVEIKIQVILVRIFQGIYSPRMWMHVGI